MRIYRIALIFLFAMVSRLNCLADDLSVVYSNKNGDKKEFVMDSSFAKRFEELHEKIKDIESDYRKTRHHDSLRESAPFTIISGRNSKNQKQMIIYDKNGALLTWALTRVEDKEILRESTKLLLEIMSSPVKK